MSDDDRWLSPRDRIMRAIHRRVVGLFVRYGLLKHPWGREYAKQQYTRTGKHRQPDDSGRDEEAE